MKPNIGKADKIVRLIAGIAIIATGFFMGSWWGAIGIVPIVTALINWCPVYEPLGISTCAKEEEPQQ